MSCAIARKTAHGCWKLTGGRTARIGSAADHTDHSDVEELQLPEPHSSNRPAHDRHLNADRTGGRTVQLSALSETVQNLSPAEAMGAEPAAVEYWGDRQRSAGTELARARHLRQGTRERADADRLIPPHAETPLCQDTAIQWIGAGRGARMMLGGSGQSSGADETSVALARAAADSLFDSDEAGATVPEPRGRAAVDAAVARLAERFSEVRGLVRRSMDRSAEAAESLSSDPLQGLSEVIQNADDLCATEVRYLLRADELLAAHNGSPVTLPDVVALATPWESTKAGDAEATGRFGIGLMTLRSISRTLEIHSGDYHVRFGQPTLEVADEIEVPSQFAPEGWTVLRIPLDDEAVTLDELEAWLAHRNDLTLLFLRHVEWVSLAGDDLVTVRELRLKKKRAKPVSAYVGGESHTALSQRVSTAGGERWQVVTVSVPSPSDVQRARKATGQHTTIGVALPLDRDDAGFLYAGLPVESIALPVRVNAQFDPVTSRQQLDKTPWNNALLPLITDLWVSAVLDLFRTTPTAAWRAIPLPDQLKHTLPSSLSGLLEVQLIAAARTSVSSRLELPAPGLGPLKLKDLAVEDEQLTHVLTKKDIARVAKTRAALPQRARGNDARWRTVLKDWEQNNGVVPHGVSVYDAAVLLSDADRSPEAIIALAAAIIDASFSNLASVFLASHAFLIDSTGHRHQIASGAAKNAFTRSATGLGAALGLARELHPAYFEGTEAAKTLRAWLEKESLLIEGDDPGSVIRHLAALGRSRKLISENPLGDAEVRMLRDAFSRLSETERLRLGPDVGNAILLQAQSYDETGRLADIASRPAQAYLPRSFDAAGFAAAAARTPGLIWLRARYSEVLAAGGTGPGAISFLKLLGAETKPRLQAVGSRKYDADAARAYEAHAPGRPKASAQALVAMNADHTLNDYASPDLQAVVDDIADDGRPEDRRARAIALIHSLGRGWSEYETRLTAQAVYGYYAWRHRGQVNAAWVWALRASSWLDDETGKPRRPADLHDQTRGNKAVHGADGSKFLHPEIHAAIGNRTEVLRMLGIEGEPTVRQLIEALRTLRDEQPADAARAGRRPGEAAKAQIIYLALGERLKARPGDIAARAEVADAFGEGAGLVLSQNGWRTPAECLSGDPIFGQWRDFAPVMPSGIDLWKTLSIEAPSAQDALGVLRDLAPEAAAARLNEPDSGTRTVILETLNLLSRIAQTKSDDLPPDCRRLPLWTSQGWRRTRPVYAVEDVSLADALGSSIPVWLPGAELQRFRPLVAPLKITVLGAAEITPWTPRGAEPAIEATQLLHAAIGHLHDDLLRNQPATASSLTCDWSELKRISVSRAPELWARVSPPNRDQPIEIPVEAAVDWPNLTLYIAHDTTLGRPRTVGRALASRFAHSQRDVANAWADAFDKAEQGRRAAEIQLAADSTRRLQEETDALVSDRTREIQGEAAARRASAPTPVRASDTKRPRPPSGTQAPPAPDRQAEPAFRTLVDPGALSLRDPDGTITSATGTARPKQPRSAFYPPTGLPRPRSGTAVPRQHTPARPYTALDLETTALQLLQDAIALGPEELRDLRAQRGLGADAVDGRGRYYELKAYAGPEPDTIELTATEYQRAQDDPDFFLVIVSGLENGTATPTVRIITHPLRQLQLEPTARITLRGIRTSQAIVYEYEQL